MRAAALFALVIPLASASTLRADHNPPFHYDKAEMKISRLELTPGPANVGDVGGFLGRRIALNDSNRLSNFDINKYVTMLETKKHRAWWWIGEQPGKWLEAAVYSSIEEADPKLRAESELMLKRMIAAQEPAGYLGITDPAVRTEAHPVRGMDPYEDYFTLHALLSAYEEYHDEAALDAARKFADFWVERFTPGKLTFSGTPDPADKGHTLDAGHTVHAGMEGTLLCDPVMRLYRVTGETRYLNWCRWVVGNIDEAGGQNAWTNLGKVADGKMRLDQVQPFVHAHTFHMNFLAFLQLYRATGDESILKRVTASWDDIVSRQQYVTGGVSVGEHYAAGHNLPNTGNVVETCADMSWIELSQALLELTADTKYADAIEKLMFNHLPAAQTVDGDGWRYHTPLNGVKPAGYFTGPDCCSSSGARVMAQLPTFIYAAGADGVYVNQFVASTAKLHLPSGNDVTVKIDTDFPSTGSVKISVPTSSQNTAWPLSVRLPAWCAKPTLTLNGQPAEVALKPGKYATIMRSWQPTDVLELSLPMETKFVHGDYTNEGLTCLTRGPVVYVLDTVDSDEALGARGAKGLVGIDTNATPATAAAPDGAMGPTLVAKAKGFDGSAREVTLLPFANLGRWYRSAAKKPDPRAGVYEYAVWFAASDSKAFTAAAAAGRAAAERAARLIDSVDNPAADTHDMHQTNSHTGNLNGRPWRDARDGSFSFDLKVNPETSAILNVTYWGGETGQRAFDILVDDQKIAAQTLQNDKPGEYFDVEYPIPADLTRGKAHVTVTFKSSSGTIAGGIFGVATLNAK